MLVTKMFYFSYKVFYNDSKTDEIMYPFQNKPMFYISAAQVYWKNTVGQRE